MGAARKYQKSEVPRQKAESARLKVVQGKEVGAVYVLTGNSVTIGRGEDNDVILLDLKASRRHAVMTLSQAGTWGIQDQGSANGILIRGRPVRESFLRAGDVLTIGETTLEFFTPDVGTRLLVAPPKDASKISEEQANFEAQRAKIRALAGLKGPAAAPPSLSSQPLNRDPLPGNGAASAGKAPGSNRVLVYGVFLAVTAWFLLGEESSPPKKPNPNPSAPPSAVSNLAQYLPQSNGSELGKASEQFFKAGFREFRERNYLRAKQNFETVLQMEPDHPMARLYLSNCDQEIEAAVKGYLSNAAKQIESGKLKQAKGNLEAVKRLLYRDQTNPAFQEANDQLEKVEKLLK